MSDRLEENHADRTHRGDVFMVFPYMDHDMCGLLSNSDFKLSHSVAKLLMRQILEGMDYIHTVSLITYSRRYQADMTFRATLFIEISKRPISWLTAKAGSRLLISDWHDRGHLTRRCLNIWQRNIQTWLSQDGIERQSFYSVIVIMAPPLTCGLSG